MVDGVALPTQILMDSLINLLYSVRHLILNIVRLMYLWEQLKHTLRQLFPQQHQMRFQTNPVQVKPNQKYSQSYLNDPKNRELQKQLLNLLHGDVATAKRLLKRQRELKRGQTDNWYLEKVIYDLERDRRI